MQVERNIMTNKELHGLLLAFRKYVETLNKQTNSLSLSVERLEKSFAQRQLDFDVESKQPTKYDVVIEILGSAKVWLSPLDIRRLYLDKTGERLAQSTLRNFLTEKEDDLFQRDGITRTTRWRYKDDNVNVATEHT